MTDAEIIAELKREPAAELRRLQRMPYEWKVEHALDVIREFVEHEGVNGVYVSFSGGRTAQGTMSRSPEAAAQSGKAYYQEPDR